MLCIKHHTLHLIISLFNAATKCVQIRGQQDRIFHWKEAIVSALMSGDVLVMDSIYNLYKNKLDYTGRIQSSSKRL